MASTSATASTSPTQTLNQADFLNLLVTQMSSQDPLNPESDTDFAAQLAQFSALQSAQSTQTDLQNIQAAGLIGETVTVTPTSGSTQTGGVVSSVQISSGTPQIVVNGQTYTLSQVTGIAPTPTTSTTPSRTHNGSQSTTQE
jgi:flagellar basal-body rod modification protein FlgD